MPSGKAEGEMQYVDAGNSSRWRKRWEMRIEREGKEGRENCGEREKRGERTVERGRGKREERTMEREEGKERRKRGGKRQGGGEERNVVIWIIFYGGDVPVCFSHFCLWFSNSSKIKWFKPSSYRVL